MHGCGGTGGLRDLGAVRGDVENFRKNQEVCITQYREAPK